MNNQPIHYFWMRRDLRLFDNHGLFKALKQYNRVRCVFIFDTNILHKLENPNDARVQFIHQEIVHLKKILQGNQDSEMWSDIEVWYGDPILLWRERLKKKDVGALYCNHDYEEYGVGRDDQVKQLCQSVGVCFESFKDHCVFEKDEVVKSDGTPYTVFTPYSRSWRAHLEQNPIQHYPSEDYLQNMDKFIAESIPTLALMGFNSFDFIYPDRHVAQKTLRDYQEKRNFPAIRGTSKLGIHFRFGTLSIRQELSSAIPLSTIFVNELIWRDFYQQILWHFPHVKHGAFKPKYGRIEWKNDDGDFEKWKNGLTGYPIVDAGMRELNKTGFMHNRVRMIVASFLCKHLLIDWRWGEAYFAEKLLDFDLASNNGGWQWAAGSGVDAAPYFRVFNPTLQTEKFDKQWDYIKEWVPEVFGSQYPQPMVDHAFARKRCLTTYAAALNSITF